MKQEDKNNGKGGPNQITLIFVINGEPFEVKTNINAPLKSAVEKALEESENTGRPLDDWQVKWNGNVLNMNLKVEDLGLPNRAELLLSLKIGQGGSIR